MLAIPHTLLRCRFSALVMIVGLLAVHAGARAQPKTNFRADYEAALKDIDLSRNYLKTHLDTLTGDLKKLSGEVEFGQDNADFEQKLESKYKRLTVGLEVLLVQTYLAAVDRHVADAGIEDEAVRRVAQAYDMAADDITGLRNQGHNWSTILLAHSLGRVTGKDPKLFLDEHAAKTSWAEVAIEAGIDPKRLPEELGRVLQ